jgi:hypothetical protein
MGHWSSPRTPDGKNGGSGRQILEDLEGEPLKAWRVLRGLCTGTLKPSSIRTLENDRDRESWQDRVKGKACLGGQVSEWGILL